MHYHFICVVGKCADGYIVMDGDNYLIEQELAIYSYATLQAADICGLLILDVVGSTPVTTSPQGSQMDLQFFTPNADGSFHCIANGKRSSTVFLTLYEANDGLFRLGFPLTDEYGDPAMARPPSQIFERGALVWDAARVYRRSYWPRLRQHLLRSHR